QAARSRPGSTLSPTPCWRSDLSFMSGASCRSVRTRTRRIATPRPDGDRAVMSQQPAFETIRAATLVDPSAVRTFSLKDRPCRGDGLFPDKARAKESIRKDARAIDALQDALYA